MLPSLSSERHPWRVGVRGDRTVIVVAKIALPLEPAHGTGGHRRHDLLEIEPRWSSQLHGIDALASGIGHKQRIGTMTCQ